ncbi:ketoacyl-ACP synthase III [Streptomyces sp. BHT-5-2]|uniref:beta-ketoacyl-ACP synthase III n=1 Tax=Streptomyces sp. BHT-5-2 TaxID=2866715 RepID=UPI001C8DF3A6|nr:beta-ketoacyl-ACP synthase III [Streptomyces sp. BHT-5-2]QZL05106.1 ketoacyl-ACP synthase III [Streptomyces sp. BHT-5-2]
MYQPEDSAQAPAAPTAVLTGLGSWLPPHEITNDELCAHLDTSDTWIRERIGISVRRRADPKTATGDLAAEAGARALRSAGVTRADAVILATTTPDHPCPATAPAVAARLGLGDVAAFDVAAGCSGFLYATTVAAGLIRSGTAGRVLVIGAETMSAVIDPEDRSTAPIFGDGAGAAVLEAGRPGQAGAIGKVVWGSDGARSEAIVIPVGGSRNRDGRDAAPPSERHVRMRGNEVLRHAVRRMTAAATQAAEAAGWALEDVDRLIVHQANARISAGVSAALGIPPERVPSNIATVGNTAAASIPLLLADATAQGALHDGHRVLLVAFGSGLAWAATTLVWPAGLRVEI